MARDNYRFKIKDFIPIVGLNNYESRNLYVTDPNILIVELDKRARGRKSFLEAYNFFVIVSAGAGLGLLIST